MLPNILMFHVHYVKPQSAGLQVLGKDFFCFLFMHLFMAPVSTVKSPYYDMGYIRYSLYYD